MTQEPQNFAVYIGLFADLSILIFSRILESKFPSVSYLKVIGKYLVKIIDV